MNYWGKKLRKISLFKDIFWNEKFKKKKLPNVFLSQKISRNHTIVLKLFLSYIWRKYSFWDDFMIQGNLKKAEIWYIS